MEFIPYKANESFANLYYQVPMELFSNALYKDKLNSDSKLLYGFLLNRLALSIKNNWVDENGNIYLIFTRKNVQELLNLSDKTVTKAFRQLTDCSLIFEKKQGYTKPNLIYVGKIKYENSTQNMNRKISDSRIVNSTTHDTENLRLINNNINNNNNKYNNNFQKFDNRFFDPTGQYEDLSKYYFNLGNN